MYTTGEVLLILILRNTERNITILMKEKEALIRKSAFFKPLVSESAKLIIISEVTPKKMIKNSYRKSFNNPVNIKNSRAV